MNLKNVRKKDFINKIVLAPRELFFLRLTVHGFDRPEICKFLELSSRDIYFVEEHIKTKFELTDMSRIIVKAFETGFLKPYDFTNEVVKKAALDTSVSFYDNYLNITAPFPIGKLKEELMTFYKQCEEQLFCDCVEVKKAFAVDTLTPKEIEVLNLKYLGFPDASIKNHVDCDQPELRSILESITEKFGEKTWFNIYRAAFNLKILRRDLHNTKVLMKEVDSYYKKMKQLKELKRMSLPEKKLNIYHYLVQFFNDVEFAYLLRRDV